jgi:hypothetical protein
VSYRRTGPACRCGVRRKPANSTLFVEDDGKCFVHPEREPQRYSIGAKPTCCDNPATEVTLKDGEAGRKCRSCGKFTNYGGPTAPKGTRFKS